MTPPLSVNIIYNKTNTFGLTDDITVIERLLRKLQDSVGCRFSKSRLLDIREPLIHCDIQFHLEIPVFGAISWAHTNILLVNPEQWSYAYDDYVHAFDALLFRDPASAEKYRTAFAEKGIRNDHIYVVPWCAALQVSDIKYPFDKNTDEGFVCFIAGSTSKYEYVRKLLPHWTAVSGAPALTIYTTRQDFADNLRKLVKTADNIRVNVTDLSAEQRNNLMARFRGHLVVSEGEAFGYAAANAEVFGAFAIMNFLPAFEYTYDNPTGIAWLSNKYTDSNKVRYSFAEPSDNVRGELEAAFDTFKKSYLKETQSIRQKSASSRFASSCTAFLPALKSITSLVHERRPSKGIFHCPPVLNINDCPPISIITPTYNREKLIDIAFHNLLSTDYPHDKIEWIVIEDNEKTPHLASEKIISFQIQVPDIKLKYIPIEGRMTIGEKRNIAIEHASNDIILFMDDDDHYPTTSFRRRVAWLTKGTKRGETGKANIVCCTTLALYDLKFGTSAVNVPPFEIPFSQRISEATLTFKKSAWTERKFPNVSIAEGEDWIKGREDQVIEIPPQQIIVAFSHGANQSSRRIPPSESKPACFWGFPKEYLIFIHKLAGVEVEEDTKPQKTSKPKKN